MSPSPRGRRSGRRARQSAFTRPTVFIGPSISHERAQQIWSAPDYRAPARNGDLETVSSGIVGLVDAYLEGDSAVTVAEVERAIARGLTVIGSSAAGAWFACQLAEMRGLGHVYDMYRSGLISDLDEVALLFSPSTFERATIPLVAIRHAVTELVRSGTIDAEDGRHLLRAAQALGYKERTSSNILRHAGLSNSPDSGALTRMLAAHDIMREDAHLLIERLKIHGTSESKGTVVSDFGAATADARGTAARNSVFIWEYGDAIPFDDLILFLKITGEMEGHVRDTLARSALGGQLPPKPPRCSAQEVRLPAREDLLESITLNWGWMSTEEVKLTLRELGITYSTLRTRLDDEIRAVRTVTETLHSLGEERDLQRTLLDDLLLDQLTLKRAALRLGSLKYFESRGAASSQAISEVERQNAEHALCLANGVLLRSELDERATRQGVTGEQLDSAISSVALARRGASEIAASLWAARPRRVKPIKIQNRVRKSVGLVSSRKARGSRRFFLPMTKAEKIANQVAQVVGITRIDPVTDPPLGVYVSVAERPSEIWARAYGTGKSRTKAGARVGAVLEEVEKFGQDQFSYEGNPIVASYRRLRAKKLAVVDPASLDIPYDGCYRPELEIEWGSCPDLLGDSPVLVPLASLVLKRQLQDIYFSPRAGLKLLSSNGLAAGFCAAEALLHGICEVIERHALYLAELRISNPGDVGPNDFRFVELTTLPLALQKLVAQLQGGGYQVRILDVTCEIRVPTFIARLDHQGTGGFGYAMPAHAAHPDPEVAIESALLEAAQGIAGELARERSTSTVKARSQGRHQRPRPQHAEARTFWLGDATPTTDFSAIAGFVDTDLLAELEWVLAQVAEAGFQRVLAHDLSRPEIAPVRVFRTMIPGAESITPHYIGPRARAQALRYLLYPRLSVGRPARSPKLSAR